MFEVVKQREGRTKSISRHVDCGSWHPSDTLAFQVGYKSIDWNANLAEPTTQNAPPSPPRQHKEKDRRRDEQRETAAMHDFKHVRSEECEIDYDKECSDWQSRPRWPVPSITGHEIKQNCRDEHRGGDRHAVSCGEITRGSEAEHKRDAGDHQSPIHRRHINLPHNTGRCIDDFQTRTEAKLNGLHGE